MLGIIFTLLQFEDDMYLLITRHAMDLITCSLLVWLLHFNLLSIFQVDVLESMKHFVHVNKMQKEN